MPQLYLARQPIYNRKLDVFAYELLYRAADEENAPDGLGEQATSTVLSNALTEFGLNDLVGSSYAFINLTREFLVGETPLPFSGHKVVLEVLEDIPADKEVIDGVNNLIKQGYKIALDDFIYDDKFIEIIKICDFIKIDILALDKDALKNHVEILSQYDVKLLAEKVETQDEYEYCKDLGFDYFQGYFFCKPKILKRKQLPANRMAVVQLLALLRNPDININKLSDLISQDVSLSYRLLRYVNSAMYSLPKKVESIRHAVVYLGLGTVKQLAMVLAMAKVDDKPHELLVIALLRAKMCELLAELRGHKGKDSFFVVGLFSVLDALLDMQMDELLTTLSMADEINSALLSYDGEAGEILKCVVSYEQGKWDDPSIGMFEPEELNNIYFEAVSWSDAVASDSSRT